VTGNLGDSAAGLAVMLNNGSVDKTTEKLIHIHHHPKTYIAEGQWMGKQEHLHAMIDLSDGFASDIQHIMNRSGVGALIDLDKLPLSDELKEYGQANNLDVKSLAASGGEDYCLMCTIDASHYPAISKKYEAEFHTPLNNIGEIKEAKHGLVYVKNNNIFKLEEQGFDHFQ
jgi:thiamine-monophosphate kinase